MTVAWPKASCRIFAKIQKWAIFTVASWNFLRRPDGEDEGEQEAV